MKPLYVVTVDALSVAYENGDNPQKDYADYYAQKKESSTYAARLYPDGIKNFEMWIFSAYK